MTMLPRIALSIISFVAVAACANGVKQKMTDDLPTCTTLADCNTHDGQRVHVVGVYTLHNPMPSRALDEETAPVRIALTDELGPFVAAYWHGDAVRAPAEKTRYQGQRVRVTGTFRRTMPAAPDPRMAQLGGPCIHPVETIEPAD